MNDGVMFGLMVLSGLLSSMNVFADKLGDVYLTLNDLYMSLLMTGWMFLFMGLYSKTSRQMYVGLVCIAVSFVAIRMQLFIGSSQYAMSMIPHHSMAVLMSKRVLEKQVKPPLATIAGSIVAQQAAEIEILKSFVSS